jgi:long-chain acyl-CoA synthetase
VSVEKSDNIKEVKPTVITVVPRLIEKYMIKSMPKAELTGIKKETNFGINL